MSIKRRVCERYNKTYLSRLAHVFGADESLVVVVVLSGSTSGSVELPHPPALVLDTLAVVVGASQPLLLSVVSCD